MHLGLDFDINEKRIKLNTSEAEIFCDELEDEVISWKSTEKETNSTKNIKTVKYTLPTNTHVLSGEILKNSERYLVLLYTKANTAACLSLNLHLLQSNIKTKERIKSNFQNAALIPAHNALFRTWNLSSIHNFSSETSTWPKNRQEKFKYTTIFMKLKPHQKQIWRWVKKT